MLGSHVVLYSTLLLSTCIKKVMSTNLNINLHFCMVKVHSSIPAQKKAAITITNTVLLLASFVVFEIDL